MSQDNDKIKEDNIAVNVPVSNSANNNAVSNEVNNEEAKVVSNGQNTSVNKVNNVRQELVPKPNPSSYPLIREKIVSKATEFLTAAAVKSTPIERKIIFLREKGLTDQEIQESFNRASVLNQNQNVFVQSPLQGYYNVSNTSGAVQIPYQSQRWFRRIFWPLTVVATVAYIGYQLYKKYVEYWLFGKRKSTLYDRLEAIESSLQRIAMLLEESKNISESLNEPANRSREFDIIRADLKSIKSLFLNRSQFPPAPASSSIPQWQLLKNTKPQAERPKNDTENTLQQSPINDTANTSLHVHHTVNVESNSTVSDDQCKLNKLTPNNQNCKQSNDVVINGKDDANH